MIHKLREPETAWIQSIHTQSDTDFRRVQPGPIEHHVAEHFVSLVPRGATLRFYIGAMPYVIMACCQVGTILEFTSDCFATA